MKVLANVQAGGPVLRYSPTLLRKTQRRRISIFRSCHFASAWRSHGGMSYVLSVNPGVKIYAPKEGFGVYGTDLPGTSNLVEPEKRSVSRRAYT